MAKYESSVKHISYPVECVYGKVSDLNNLAIIKERINDPLIQQQIPADKLGQVKEAIDKLEFTADTVVCEAGGMVGTIGVEIVEREENKCVKYASTSSPVSFRLWVQVLPTGDATCKMKLTLEADLNFLMKQMLNKPLAEGIEKLADMLALIPYN
jgi:hypothetical protein